MASNGPSDISAGNQTLGPTQQPQQQQGAATDSAPVKVRSTSIHRVASNTNNSEPEECRICLLSATEVGEPLIHAPCDCHGSLSACHFSCLSRWALEKRSLVCELCKAQYKEPWHGRLATQLEEHPVPEFAGHANYPTITTLEGRPIVNNELPTTTWQSVMCHILVLLVLLAVILYLTVFSNIAPAASSDWTNVLWRVLTILIPGYLIGRMVIIIFMRWVSDRRIRREQARRMREHAVIIRALTESAAAIAEFELAQQQQRQQQQQQSAANGNSSQADGDAQTGVSNTGQSQQQQQLHVVSSPGHVVITIPP